MGGLRLSRVYCLFVVPGAAQLGVFGLIGQSTITARGLVPILLLVTWLGYGSKLAWGLLLVLNVSMLVAGLAIVFSSPGGGRSGAM